MTDMAYTTSELDSVSEAHRSCGARLGLPICQVLKHNDREFALPEEEVTR